MIILISSDFVLHILYIVELNWHWNTCCWSQVYICFYLFWNFLE